MTTPPTAEQQTGQIWEYLKGFHAVHLIDVGVRLGLFAKLKEKPDQTATELAAEEGLHEFYVAVWCRTGVAYGLLDGDDGPPQRFRLASYMDQILADPGGPRHLAPYCTTATDFLAADFSRYPELFRNGGAFTFQEHGDAFTAAIGGITGGFHAVFAKRLLPSLPGLKEKLAQGCRILDMGCGAGNLLMRIAEAHPKAECVGVDVDAHGVAQAQKLLAQSPLADRVRIEHLAGEVISHRDAFDVAIMFEVLHEIPLAVRPQVLANCHRALKPGGTLVILDETLPTQLADLRRPEYLLSVQTQWNELIWGNVVPTAPEQEALLGGAGFGKIARQSVAGLFTLLTAVK